MRQAREERVAPDLPRAGCVQGGGESLAHEAAERTPRDSGAPAKEHRRAVSHALLVPPGPPTAAGGPREMTQDLLEHVLLVVEDFAHVQRHQCRGEQALESDLGEAVQPPRSGNDGTYTRGGGPVAVVGVREVMLAVVIGRIIGAPGLRRRARRAEETGRGRWCGRWHRVGPPAVPRLRTPAA